MSPSSSSSASSSNPQSANPNPEREEEQTSTRRGRSFSRLSQQSQPRRICDTVQVGVALLPSFLPSSVPIPNPHFAPQMLSRGKLCVSEVQYTISITNLFHALADKCTLQPPTGPIASSRTIQLRSDKLRTNLECIKIESIRLRGSAE